MLELVSCENTCGSKAIAKVCGNDYKLVSPFTNAEVRLKRDIHFGVVPKTKSPSLYKAGAEAIISAYGLMPRFTIESKEECFGENPFFYYLIRCDLVKVSSEGKEYVFSSGIGSSNTREKRNGFSGAYDAANGTCKMAKKRALVDAAITISGVSDLFTQDMENESFMTSYSEIAASTDENAPISTKQMKRVYALAANAGYNAKQAKDMIIAAGYSSTKDITQKDYEKVCGIFDGGEK